MGVSLLCPGWQKERRMGERIVEGISFWPKSCLFAHLAIRLTYVQLFCRLVLFYGQSQLNVMCCETCCDEKANFVSNSWHLVWKKSLHFEASMSSLQTFKMQFVGIPI